MLCVKFLWAVRAVNASNNLISSPLPPFVGAERTRRCRQCGVCQVEAAGKQPEAAGAGLRPNMLLPRPLKRVLYSSIFSQHAPLIAACASPGWKDNRTITSCALVFSQSVCLKTLHSRTDPDSPPVLSDDDTLRGHLAPTFTACLP